MTSVVPKDEDIKQDIEINSESKKSEKIESFYDKSSNKFNEIYSRILPNYGDKKIFDNIANLIQIILILLIFSCVILLLAIFCLLFISLILVIIYILYDIIKSILNDNNMYLTSYDYSYLNYSLCTNVNYTQDPLYLFMQEYINIILFNIYYTIAIICIVLIIIYISIQILDFTQTFNNENHISFIGKGLNNISPEIFYVLLILVIYSVINYIIYKNFFINNIIQSYIDTKASYLNIDNEIYPLLFKLSDNNTNTYVYDDNYYTAIKNNDIDNINNIINTIINNNDADKCLVNYLHIYNFYKYFHSYVPLNVEIYKNAVDNYLTCGKDVTNVTFYSLSKMQTKQLMTKNFNDLDFYINIDKYSTDKEELISNALDKIGDDINIINKFIINSVPPAATFPKLVIYILVSIIIICLAIFITLYMMYIYKETFGYNIFYIIAKYVIDKFNSIILKK